jgi:hypothetical protein
MEGGRGVWEGLQKILPNSTSLFQCFAVNIGGGGVGRFVSVVMVVERGCLVLAYQQQPLLLKNRSVLPGINCLQNIIHNICHEKF